MVRLADVIEELQIRRRVDEVRFDKQRLIEQCKAKRIAVLTSRRSGKTNGILLIFIEAALNNPISKQAYISLTASSAEEIVWPELKRINMELGLGIEFKDYRLRAQFPNGADITLFGANEPRMMKRFHGRKYLNVAVDEAQGFTINLESFIEEDIGPTLADLLGKLYLSGTPGLITSGLWWEITRPELNLRKPGWEVFQWGIEDNPHMLKQWNILYQDMRQKYGDALDLFPWFIRQWRGQWCVDSGDNVYAFDYKRNTVDSWEPSKGERFIMGVDAGYTDAMAFNVGAYNPTSKNLTFIDCYKQSEMLFDDAAAKINEFRMKYPGLRIIGDYASRRFLEEMRKRHRIPIEDAQKTEKHDAIRVMNNDFASGDIRILLPQCGPYMEELVDLKKLHKLHGEWEEHPKLPNDLCDCALYVHRESLHYASKKIDPKPQPGTAQFTKELEDKLFKQARDKIANVGKKPWWDY